MRYCKKTTSVRYVVQNYSHHHRRGCHDDHHHHHRRRHTLFPFLFLLLLCASESHEQGTDLRGESSNVSFSSLTLGTPGERQNPAL